MVKKRDKETSVSCSNSVESSVECCSKPVPNYEDVISICCAVSQDRVSSDAGNEYVGSRIDGKAIEERGRKRCSCWCHLQKSSQRNCPQNFKSRNNIGVDELERAPYYTVGEHKQQELRNEVAGNVTSHPENTNNTESHRQYTGSRNRLKRDEFLQSEDNNNVLSSSTSTSKSSVFKSWRTRLSAKKTMCRIVCQCFLVIVLCLCGTVLMTRHNYDSLRGNIIHTAPQTGLNTGLSETQESVSIIKDLPFKSVPIELLEKRIETANSAADMLKIFFDDQNLSDDAVNSILWMKTHQTLYGSGEKKRNHQFIGDAEEDMAKYREDAYKHITSVSSFTRCSEPKPEVVQVEDPQRSSFKHFYPSCTVLHRCSENTGCCPKGHRCVPKGKNGIELVTRRFMVFEKSLGGHVKPNENNIIEEKVMINHTACECKEIVIDSGCHKHCPSQFVKQRPGEKCECVCKHNNKKCRQMYRGLHALTEKDLECIKKDECILPSCHTGEFKIHTGYCPYFRHHKHHHQKHHRHKKG